MRTLGEQEWEKMQQAHILSNVQQAFDVSSDVEGDDNESIFSAADILSPSGHTDAQTLALMLQEQLDAINNEIRSATIIFYFYYITCPTEPRRPHRLFFSHLNFSVLL